MNDERHSVHAKVSDHEPTVPPGLTRGPFGDFMAEQMKALRADAQLALANAAQRQTTALPTDAQARKDTPIARGVLDYFPAALAEVARVSKAGNDQHNPGQEMHHARGKASDHADCIVRHLIERGTIDTDGMRHSAKVAWRALALLQEELEAAGAPLARGAKVTLARGAKVTPEKTIDTLGELMRKGSIAQYDPVAEKRERAKNAIADQRPEWERT